MKSQVLLTVWCNISGEAAGEIWSWSFLGVKGLTFRNSKKANWRHREFNTFFNDPVSICSPGMKQLLPRSWWLRMMPLQVILLHIEWSSSWYFLCKKSIDLLDCIPLQYWTTMLCVLATISPWLHNDTFCMNYSVHKRSFLFVIIYSQTSLFQTWLIRNPCYFEQADSPLFDRHFVLTWLFWNPAISNFFSCPVRLRHSGVWL